MDVADQLLKLQSMREQGALTEEEFTLAKRRVLDGMPPPAAPQSTVRQPSALHQLKRSLADRWIGGVCGGLADMTNLPSWSWRILFLLTVLLHGLGVLAYLLLWIFVPLQMQPPRALAEAPGQATPPPA
ncbi:MAG: PspC domain-containing protein [Betaproteobacteria bacterium]